MSAPMSSPSSLGRPPPPLAQIGTISTDDYFQSLPTELRIAIIHRCHSAIDIEALIFASPAMLACFEENRNRCLQGVAERLKYQIQSDLVLSLALLAGRLRHVREKYQGCSREVLRSKIQQVLKEEVDLEGWENNLIVLCHLTPLFHSGKEFVSQTGPQVPSMPLSTPPDMQLHTSYFIISMMQGFEEYRVMWEKEGLEAYFRFDGYCNALFYGQEPLFKESSAIEEQFFRFSGIGDNRTEALVVLCKIMKNIFLGPCELEEGWGPYLLRLTNPGHEGPRRNWTTKEMKRYFPLVMLEIQGERDVISWEEDIFRRLECVEKHVYRLCGDDTYTGVIGRPPSAMGFPAGLHMCQSLSKYLPPFQFWA
ncbi:hypothetical protein BHE90_000878 [Fusarium euwallaceae]|uniref:Uncharacterized protein n=1 Tax=Fusarium euwallaceae TaxID=1147111 RepID=A0A430M9G2_9HYPO|nr:hypothetical protein BHE90_000878 [Fusarium euwallaceae]